MNKELTKKLKDVGFESKDSALINSSSPDKDGYITPHLSELIEACGNKFSSLENWSANFVAIGYERQGGIEHKGKGKTPEEAVANLWLELNKK